jgi:hypothetical protein
MHTVIDACEIDTAETVGQDHDTGGTTATITTTLYDLIATVQTAVAPPDDDLVVATLWHVLRSGHATWHRTYPPHRT